MAPMKQAAVKSITKGGIADALANETELKKSDCMKVLNSLASVAAAEVKKGKFTVPGVCMIKTRVKPATKAGKRVFRRREPRGCIWFRRSCGCTYDRPARQTRSSMRR